MPKLRNLDQLSSERRAALEAMLTMPLDAVIPEAPVIPDHLQPVTETSLAELEAIIEAGVLARTIGELLETARTTRGVGVRELARRLGVDHARVKQLEHAGRGRPGNVELRSLTRQAEALEYRVRIILEPKDGGPILTAQLG